MRPNSNCLPWTSEQVICIFCPLSSPSRRTAVRYDTSESLADILQLRMKSKDTWTSCCKTTQKHFDVVESKWQSSTPLGLVALRQELIEKLCNYVVESLVITLQNQVWADADLRNALMIFLSYIVHLPKTFYYGYTKQVHECSLLVNVRRHWPGGTMEYYQRKTETLDRAHNSRETPQDWHIAFDRTAASEHVSWHLSVLRVPSQ